MRHFQGIRPSFANAPPSLFQESSHRVTCHSKASRCLSHVQGGRTHPHVIWTCALLAQQRFDIAMLKCLSADRAFRPSTKSRLLLKLVAPCWALYGPRAVGALVGALTGLSGPILWSRSNRGGQSSTDGQFLLNCLRLSPVVPGVPVSVPSPNSSISPKLFLAASILKGRI